MVCPETRRPVLQLQLDRLGSLSEAEIDVDTDLAGTVALSVHVRCGEAGGMKRRRSCPPIMTGSEAFAGFRFPPEVILLAVRWAKSTGRRNTLRWR